MSYIPRRIRSKVIRDAQRMCEFCGMSEEEHRLKRRDSGGLHLHHVWPDRHGGEESTTNLIALCDGCHGEMEADTRSLIRTNRWGEDVAKARVRYLAEKRRRREYPTGVSGKMAALHMLRGALRKNDVPRTAAVYDEVL